MLDLRLILVSIMWGVNFSLVKFALTDFTPLSFTIVRFALAAGFLFIVLLMNKEPLDIGPDDRLPLLRLGLIGISLYNILFMYGLRYTTASNSALFIATSPLFAALILTLTKRERFSLRSGAGFLLSSLGTVLIIRSRLGGFGFRSEHIAGDLLTLAAACAWAFYTVNARPLLENYSPIKITAYTMAIGTLAMVPIGFHELMVQPWNSISLMSWSALFFGAFFAGGVAYTLWYQGVKRIGSSRTIVYHYLMPFTAVAFAAVFLGERITAMQVIGGIAVLSGVALVQKPRSLTADS